MTKALEALSASDNAALSRVIAQTAVQQFAAVYSRMRSARAKAAVGNPRTLSLYAGLSGAPSMSATVPTAGASPATVLFAATSGGVATALYDVRGGWAGINSSYIIPLGVTKNPSQTTAGGSSSVANQSSQRVAFYSTAATVIVRLIAGQGANVRVLIDGQYTSLTGYAFTANGAVNYLTLPFASRAPQGRLIELEVAAGNTQGGSNSVMQFGGVYQAQNEQIWAPSKGLRLIVAGDSYTNGVGAAINGDGLVAVAKDYLGIDDLWPSGLGGSGWIVRPSGTESALRDRLFDITGNSPDLAVIMMGANEANLEGSTFNGITVSTLTTQAEVTAQLLAIRAALPNLPIIVTGPWRFASATQRSRVAGYEAAISAGVAALNDPLIAFRPFVGASPAYQTGSGYQGAPAYDGIGDWAIWTDQTHASPDGHAHLGQRLATDIMAGLRTIAINLGLPTGS